MSTLGKREDYSLYSNAFGFLRQPLDFDPVNADSDVIVTGIPFDIATTGRSGSRFGPEAIRKASVNLAWEGKRYPWFYNFQKHLSVADCGDLVFDCGDAQDMCDTLFAHSDQIIASGKRMLSFGGDHFVTLPLLRAHAKHYGPLALVHFDAHTDDYDQGGKFDHGTMFHHAQTEGLIDASASVQIGIRTTYDHENTPFNVLDASYVNSAPVDEILQKIRETVGDRRIYLTFDVDGLDPAYAPGTGTPVCGGLTTDRALHLLRGLQGLDIVGMDVVEVAPAYDHGDITALAGATVALEMLYLQAELKKQ
ncbi:agmatinase [Endozoicomonas sp. OPT23]|uniref:agmatinase n=1 Tax=Endozoicomonas sp. OPT23 TaxID=2072845 RepID=UPI00129AF63B|nr:agmatinase [Endozoicomonas sp. OPT23]MRI33364.1 agmatinase [Endozoicomonas sp. OPT23]